MIMNAQKNCQQACFWGLKNKHFWLRGCGPSLYIYACKCIVTYGLLFFFDFCDPEFHFLDVNVEGSSLRQGQASTCQDA